MKNLTLSLLGLVFVPACFSANDKSCFSQKLNPSYPCCTGDKVVYTDGDGDWGVENGQWCGIAKEPEVTCFSLDLGYPCCKTDKVVYTDEDGEWGMENNHWCGIVKDDSCFSLEYGYPCCESCTVVFADEKGRWGKENKKWCGIKNSCGLAIEDPENLVEGDPNFDYSILKLKNNKENMIYSPLSIKYALYMLKEGASGNTLDEIENVVGNAELTKYENVNKTLSLANGLFVRDTFYKYVKQEFMDTLAEKYNAEVKKDPFENAKNVNNWIEEKTLGVIKNMMDDDTVRDPNTAMLIVNALAMDIEWTIPFYNTSTYGEPFYLDNGEEMKATMMHRSEEGSTTLRYYIDEDITAFTKDLKEQNGVKFEFLTLMPNSENLSTFVENVTKEKINEIDNKLQYPSSLDKVNLTFPKFKFNYKLNLNSDLQKLGINDAFDKDKANFSKMKNSEIVDFYVSHVLHQADIDIAEEGVKAAASTVVVVGGMTSSAPVRYNYIDIEINKPFMFVIRDKTTKDVWFTGTVYKPNSWEDEKNNYENGNKK